MQHHDNFRDRLNTISYLSYYFIGALVSILGILAIHRVYPPVPKFIVLPQKAAYSPPW